MKEETVIDRMIQFAEWCKTSNRCKSKSDFERKCGLTHNYLYNTSINTKSNVGVDHIAKIHKMFPELNIIWVITGKGSMLVDDPNKPDEGYKEAYKALSDKLAMLKGLINQM